jgi:putative PEP-CTERM system histidine kinase
MSGLLAFWSHALAAVAFAALAIWRLREAARRPGQRLLLGAFALTACWAWLSAVAPGDPLVEFAESARNLIWVALLYNLSVASDQRQHGVRLVYAAVAASIGLQLVADALAMLGPSGTVAQTALILHLTTAAGSLVLVHNVYGQAAPASRSSIRLAMLGLAMMWVYDLNYYTVAYLGSPGAAGLDRWRGLAIALTAPLFALGLRGRDAWRIRLSRAATFQSLSLLAICAYFALMAIVATALRGSSVDWPPALTVAVLAVMTVGAMVVLPSGRARGWLKAKAARHLFEHRFDYRAEWLRFTDTLGRAGADEAPLGERIVKAFADIAEAPGGLLLAGDGAGGPLSVAATWNWPGEPLPANRFDDSESFWAEVERGGRVIELDAIRHGWASGRDKALVVPGWLAAQSDAWAGIPLVHHGRLIGLVVLAAPEYRRALDWEDFDLLRTAGRQAASALAEALGQDALANAQRFEEFNRRFAFILHDIKNLVSQLSLLARNSERHSDNPEFRADMVGTLQSSVGKMNDLLARLAPHAPPRARQLAAHPIDAILGAAIAGRSNGMVTLGGDRGLWATVDAAALGQALDQLLQNAIEARPDGAAVSVQVARSGNSVAIAIADQGCGMDGDFILNRLFQPFVSTKAGGFGIGAFEARTAVAAMGGRISVDSRPGEGSTFTIIVPGADAPAESVRKRA